MSAQARAQAAHKAAELAAEAGDLRTAQAFRAAARAWERVAAPGVAWSTKLLRADLTQLRIDCAIARGPFQPPQPPKAPSPKADPAPLPEGNVILRPVVRPQEATIEF